MSDRTTKRYLIVNADDFGQSDGVNRGIIEAHEHGIVTSVSFMVRWPAARAAASYARRQRKLSLGLHFDFGEWTCDEGRWRPLYEVVPQNDARAVMKEANRQLEAFRLLMGTDPTHLDSHQHAHLTHALRPFFEEMAAALCVPLRSCDRRVHYVGNFYGQTTNGHTLPDRITHAALMRLLRKLHPGFTEFGCHPGYAADLQSMYLAERRKEIETLCGSDVRKMIDEMGIHLCSFHDFHEIHREGQVSPKRGGFP